MANTYLTVAYSERNAVKALGARWDPQARSWFVPEGRDLEPFGAWLPNEQRPTAVAAKSSGEGTLQVQRRGKSLVQLLAGVAEAVDRAYRQGEWTVVDVVQVSLKRHVFMEVAERDAHGVVLAKANAMIWASTAEDILPAFETATGMSVGPGMKLLLRAKPVFNPQYGFRLIVDAIDPEFTLGELEARKREIRSKLQQQGLWTLNKQLPYPWDFRTVLVVAPDEAAGLGDFRAEAQRLERAGLCSFTYAFSRFQGPGAAEEIVETAQSVLAAFHKTNEDAPDALVFIRGGGAVNDLAWLNHYDLARFVCELPIPVLTGIGHERDSTILDEVANTSFDTPSKVVAGIEATIVKRAREAQTAFTALLADLQRQTGQVRQAVEQSNTAVRAGAARQLYAAKATVEQRMTDTRMLAARAVAMGGQRANELLLSVRSQSGTQLTIARQRVPLLLAQVRDLAHAKVRAASVETRQQLRTIADRVASEVDRSRGVADGEIANVARDARQRVRRARETSEALILEISGQGPRKTLARGFAHVRDAQGRTVMGAASLQSDNEITVQFHDGSVPARVQGKENDQ